MLGLEPRWHAMNLGAAFCQEVRDHAKKEARSPQAALAGRG